MTNTVLSILLLSAIALHAQSPQPASPHFVIAGTVTDAGLNRPLPEAQITVFEFVRTPYKVTEIGKKSTDSLGAFHFDLEKAATYIVEIRKPGYNVVGGDSHITVDLNNEHPSREADFKLYSSGQLTGRVVDDETGMPIPRFHVDVAELIYMQGEASWVYGQVPPTDADGRFTATDRRPGNYLVQVSRQNADKQIVRTQFTAADAEQVDHDYPKSYWPGGHGLDSASPIYIPSGGSASAGVIRVKKADLYRVRVTMPPGACEPGEKILVTTEMIELESSGGGETPCAPAFLLTGYAPGSYRLYLLTDKSEHRMRVVSPFTVTDRNIEIKVSLVRGPDIGGRILLADGAKGPVPSGVKVSLRTADGPIQFGDEQQPIVPDASGTFRLSEAPLARQRLSVSGLGTNYYVKEIRYNGIPVSDGIFFVDGNLPAQSLDVVIDDKPATVSGVVSENDKSVGKPYVVLVRWPVSPENVYIAARHSTGDDAGQFRFSGLPPGDYRTFAIAQAALPRLDEPNVLFRLLERANKISVEQGSSQNLPLKLTDPNR